MPITLDGTLGITTPALTVTGATVNTGGISTAGNLTFTSTSQRIIGDFSNGTLSNRLAFQTSTTNATTSLTVLPNGTSTTSQLNLEGDPASANGAAAQFINVGGSDVRIASSIRGSGTYLPLTMWTGGSERMRIDTSGRVLVGLSTSGSTASKLQVTGGTTNATSLATAYSDAAVAIVPKSTSGFSLAIASGTSDFPQLQVSANGAAAGALLLQPYGGDVGIGTSSPVTKLTVTGGNGNAITSTNTGQQYSGFEIANNGSNRVTLQYDNTNGIAALNTRGANPFTFGTADTERMRITSAGNVGIGTSSPSQKLDVNGQVQFQASTSGRYFQFINDSSASYLDVSHSLNLRVNGASSLATAATITSAGLFQFNSGYGSVATAYGCRAWVNYSGSGASIRGSGNVSSVTNNGAGDNTINFSTAMPDANFSWAVTQQLNGTGNNDPGASSSARNQGTSAWGTGFVRILTMSNTNLSQENPLVLCVQVFR
jgi:hypothetical protein